MADKKMTLAEMRSKAVPLGLKLNAADGSYSFATIAGGAPDRIATLGEIDSKGIPMHLDEVVAGVYTFPAPDFEALYGRGLIGGPVLFENAIPLTAIAAFVDLPGISVDFVFNGKPIVAVFHLPYCVLSVASSTCFFGIANGADSVMQEQDSWHNSATAARQFTVHMETMPRTNMRTGTGTYVEMVVGNSYTLKARAAGNAAMNFSTVWAAGSEFFGYAAVYEV